MRKFLATSRTVLFVSVLLLSFVAFSRPQTASASSCTSHTVRYGQRDWLHYMGHNPGCVWLVQYFMGYYLSDPLATDGWFGPVTDHYVKRYQKSRGLYVDGIVGPQTWRSICTQNAMFTTPMKTWGYAAGCTKYWL